MQERMEFYIRISYKLQLENKKIDSTKMPPIQSYKELSQKKKAKKEAKQMKIKKRKENQLKKQILEEQEKLRLLKEQKERERPPPIVTLQSLMKNSLNQFYPPIMPDESHNDSTINFIKNLIAEDEDQVQQNKDIGIVEVYNPDNNQINDLTQELSYPIDQEPNMKKTPGFDEAEKDPTNMQPITEEPNEPNIEETAHETTSVKTTVDIVLNSNSNK